MRIAIDGTAPVIGGGVTYLRELVPALCAASPGDDFYLFLRFDMANLSVRASSNCTCIPVRLPRRYQVIWRFVWQQVLLPVSLLRMKADALLCPYDVASLLAPCRIVLGIQNANPYLGPSASTWLGRRRNQFLRWLTKASTWRAAGVFFVSEWSRQAISRKLGLPIERSCVIYQGVSDRFRSGNGEESRADEAARPYVLVVGSIASHKDYPTLFEAWKRILTHYGEHLHMVVVGPVLEPTYYERLRSMVSHLELNGKVAFVHEASQDEILRLYQTATVLVMPSYVETFGLPLLEAMACGIPIVASDIPVAREVCGDAASYYRLGDPGDLAEKLARLLGSPGARAEAQRAGRARARLFSWDTAASCTLRLFWGGSK